MLSLLRRVSPFEGSPRAGAAEYVRGDVLSSMVSPLLGRGLGGGRIKLQQLHIQRRHIFVLQIRLFGG